MTTTAQLGLPGHALAMRLEAFHHDLRTLSAASTLPDLAARFSASLREAYPASEILLLHRPAGSASWQRLCGKSDGLPDGELMPATGAPHVVSTLDDAGAVLRVTVRLADQSCAGILLSQAPSGSAYTEDDLLSVRLFALLFDAAYQGLLSRRTEKDLIFSLNHRVLQLNSLIDTGIEVEKLDGEVSPEELALVRATSLTNASRGAVTVADGNGIVKRHVFPAGAPVGCSDGSTSSISSTFLFGGRTYTFEVCDKESRIGRASFDETDQLLLDALTRQVHASLENRDLHLQSLEKQKIERDIAVAASIQQRILPVSLPAIEGYDIAGINIPTKLVGGDYYDCIRLPDGKYMLVIADVAGKGVPAALLVSSLHAYLTAYLESTVPLEELAGRLNTVICRASTDDKFITAFFAVLSPGSGELQALNAGHNPAYLVRNDNSVRELNTGGIALGMLDVAFPFQSEHLMIERGERLLLYTDGITEATNAQAEMYDQHSPLRKFVADCRNDGANQFIRDLITDIKKFTGEAPQSDDITALYLLRR